MTETLELQFLFKNKTLKIYSSSNKKYNEMLSVKNYKNEIPSNIDIQSFEINYLKNNDFVSNNLGLIDKKIMEMNVFFNVKSISDFIGKTPNLKVIWDLEFDDSNSWFLIFINNMNMLIYKFFFLDLKLKFEKINSFDLNVLGNNIFVKIKKKV
jgi:hypothetical protein